MRKLPTEAKLIYRIHAGIGLLIALFFIWVLTTIIALVSETLIVLPIAFIGSILFAVVIAVLVFVFSNLWHNNWFYELTDSEIKIHYGIISKTYKTIPYTKIQNVDVHQGLIERIFGLASVNIHTAGYAGFAGYGGGRTISLAEGVIPFIPLEEAQSLSKEMLAKIKKR
jgi:membrane protein YdbS with pleckstrin-like domain